MNRRLKIKVCGNFNTNNASKVSLLDIDFMGYIFHPKSVRYVGNPPSANLFNTNNGIAKVGVFVNSSTDFIINVSKKYGFEYAQLHGNESPEICKNITNNGIKVIKAFALSSSFNFSELNNYSDHVNMFLFDTLGKTPGGTGIKFNWDILNSYKLNTPFILSGGIDAESASEINKLNHKNLYGIDINSKFENADHTKNVELIQQFINQIN